MQTPGERYEAVLQRVTAAAVRSGRSAGDVTLVAVSKQRPAAEINELQRHCSAANLPLVLGESRVQEFQRKRRELELPCRTHFIGPLQRNKAKPAAELFDVIESISSEKLAAAVNAAAAEQSTKQAVCLQVNISADPAKAGLSAAETVELVRGFERFDALELLGLMTITRFYRQPEAARGDFRRLADLRAELNGVEDLSGRFVNGRCELSMGMSSDFEVAIEEGATLVRVGTAIFGEPK